MLSNTESSLHTTAKLQPYAMGLTWGIQDIARGTYSLSKALHFSTSASANSEVAAVIFDGYVDAEDDSDEPRRGYEAPL